MKSNSNKKIHTNFIHHVRKYVLYITIFFSRTRETARYYLYRQVIVIVVVVVVVVVVIVMVVIVVVVVVVGIALLALRSTF